MSRLLSLCALLAAATPVRADAPPVMVGDSIPPEAIARFGVPGRNWKQYYSAGAYTPSGAFRVAVADGKEIRVWAWQPAHARRPVHRLTGHAADVQHLAMSPDAKFLVTADKGGEVRLWELVSGECTVLKKLGPAVTALAVGSGGRRVAVAAGTVVVLHDLGDDDAIAIGKHVRPVTALAFAPTGGRLATATAHGMVTLWKIDGTKVADLTYDVIPEPAEAPVPVAPPVKEGLEARGADGLAVNDFDQGVRKLVFSPDGKRLAAAGGTVVRMWDVADRRVLWQHNRHSRLTAGGGPAFGFSGTISPAPTGPRQLGRVHDLAFSRDGLYLASTGNNGDLHVTHAEHGEDLRKPRPWPQFAESRAGFDGWSRIAFAPDGRTFTQFNGIRKIVQERIASGLQVALAGGHEWGVAGLAVTPDGRYLASFGEDQRIRLWRLSNGECLSETIAGGTSFGGLRGMAFSPDGKWFVTGGTYHGFSIYRVVGDPPRLVMKDNYDRYMFNAHAFLPGHDARLYGTVRDYGQSRALDLPDRKAHGPGFATSNEPRDLAVSADGKLVAVAYGISSTPVPDVMNVASGKRAVTLAAPPGRWTHPGAVEFSADGRLLAGLANSGVTLWDVATGKVYFYFATPGQRPWASMTLSPDGRVVAVGGAGFIQLYETATGRRLRNWTDIPGAASLHFLKSGLLLSGGADGAVYIWDARADLRAAAELPKVLGQGIAAPAESGQWARRFPLPYRAGGLAFSADGTTLAAGSWGKVHLFDLTTDKETAVLTADNSPVRCLTFSRDGNTLAASAYHFDGKAHPIRVYDLPGGKERWRSGPTTQFPESLAFSRDERTLYTIGRDVIHCWNPDTGEVLDPIKLSGLAGSALAVSPGGKRMLVCGWSTSVSLLELPGGREAHRLAASDDPSNNDWIHAVAFHPTDGTAVTVSREGVLRWWDVATGKRLAEWSVAPGAMDVAFSPKGDYIALSGDATMSGMGRVDVWEVSGGKERLRLTGNGPRVAWSPDGRWLATGDTGTYDHRERHVLIWDVGTMLKK